MKKQVKLICGLLALALAAGLAACGGEGQNENNGEEIQMIKLEAGVSAIAVPHHDRVVHGDAYIPDAGDFPLVIFSHGYNGYKDDFKTDAQSLMDQGIAAITFTFCGSGARDPSGFGTKNMTLYTEREDLEALIDYAKTVEGFNGELYLFGGSQGGMVSALTAQERADDIAGLALIFPAFSIPDDWAAKYPRDTYPEETDIPETIPWWGVNLGRAFAATARETDVYLHMAEFTKPVLLFHGTADNIVDISYSDRASAAYPNCWYKTYPNAGHGFPPEIMSEIDDYLVSLITTGALPTE